jgi:hypothetical protein
LYVSKGNSKDKLMIDVKKPEMFISATTGEIMSMEAVSFSGSMPTQVPKGVDAEAMVETTAKQTAVVIGVVIV